MSVLITVCAWLRYLLLVVVAALACDGGATTAAWADETIPILVYHRFALRSTGPTTVTTTEFEQQLDWLADHQFRVVPLHSAVDAVRGTHPSSAGAAVAITVDDGHESVYTQLYPIVLRRHLPVTLFIYPSAISRASYALTWEQLDVMHRSGLVDVQSHTFWHPNFRTERKRLGDDAYQTFVYVQLTRSKRELERRLGLTVDLLAWPYGIVDAELEQAAARAGYSAAFAYAGGPAQAGDEPFAIPRIAVSDGARGDVFAALVDPTRARRRAR